MKFSFLSGVFLALGVAVSLTGCGTVVPVESATTGQQRADAVGKLVSERAQQRWDALIKRDMDAAYQFISPGGRSLMSLQDYRPRANTAFWRGAKVKEASCVAETCDVTVLVDLFVEGVKFTNPVKETWILDAGKWWFVYQG